MADVSTIRTSGGPFQAVGTASAVIPPNAFVGTQVGSASEGFPPELTNDAGVEGMLSAATGMALSSGPLGDYVAVGQPGMYLVCWSYTLEADNPPTGPLGAIGLRAFRAADYVIGAAQDISVVAGDGPGAGRATAQGSGSNILWLAPGDPPDGSQFRVSTDRDDITNAIVTVHYTATLLQSGGQPRLHVEG